MEKIDSDKRGIAVQVAAVFSIILLVFVHIMYPDAKAYGLTAGCGWWHRVTFHFFHAGFFHMFINWWFLLSASFMYRYRIIDVLVLFVLVSLYPFAGTVAIIGLSGLVFAMAGMASIFYNNARYVIGVMLLTIALSSVVSHIAVGMHLWSYLFGIAYGLLIKYDSYITRGNIKD